MIWANNKGFVDHDATIGVDAFIYERKDGWNLCAYIKEDDDNIDLKFGTLTAALIFAGLRGGIDKIDIIFSNGTRMGYEYDN